VTRPSRRVSCFWARELLANQREHSARRCDALSTEHAQGMAQDRRPFIQTAY